MQLIFVIQVAFRICQGSRLFASTGGVKGIDTTVHSFFTTSRLFSYVNHLAKATRFIFALALLLAYGISASFAQVAGDYRSANSDDWNKLTTWERYDGASWPVPTAGQGWPGEFAGTGAVTIQAGHNISIAGNVTTVSLGTVTVNGALTLSDDAVFTLNTNQLKVTAVVGKIYFGNKAELILPLSSTIYVTNGGLIGTGNLTRIRIGSAYYAASGTGHGAVGNFPDLISPTIISTTAAARCGAGAVNLGAVLSAGSTISWYDVSIGGAALGTITSFTTPAISTTTTYYAEAKNTLTGFLSIPRTAVVATINTNPVAPTVNITDNCDGTSILTASGYTGILLWSTGATTASISVNVAGTYTVTQTVNGCTSLAGSGTTAPKTTPVVPIVTVVDNCGTSMLTASGYTGSLLWSTGATTASISVNTAAIYTVSQTENGCTSLPGTGTAAPKPIPTTITPLTQMFCNGVATTAILLTGTPSGVVFDITGGSLVGLADQTGITSIPSFTPANGSTTISITPKANGCTGTAVTVDITVTPSVGTPIFAMGTTSTRYQIAETVPYTAIAANATGGISYELDATSLAGGNAISALGVVSYAATWSGISTITATATGCNGTTQAIHTVRTTWCFALFAGAGAIHNVGASVVTGDIGTHVGAIDGFSGSPLGTLNGQSHISDATTLQAKLDLVSLYAALDAKPINHVITTLNDQDIIQPGVSFLGAAAPLNGELILDGEDNPDAVFIIKIGGALSTAASSKVTLKRSASVNNVFWLIDGVISLGASSLFQGTIISTGAINLTTGSKLVGRGLTKVGAISLTACTVSSICAPFTCMSDNQPPTFTAPGPFDFCVENLISAAYVANALQINPGPDYSLFKKTSTVFDLDPSKFLDNCCVSAGAAPSNLRWEIVFSTGQSAISGTGQPSTYLSDIKFWGDGTTYLPVVHTITWWIKDCSGNESLPLTRTITINPRPKIQ